MNDPRMEVPAPILVETEFKLALDPRDIGALKRHALLAGKTAKRVRQVDVYFDTPDLRLARNGLALRLRRAGGRWLQTLKDGGRVTAGLHQRGEWEFPLPRPSLDLRFLADTPFGKLPSDVGPKLQPAFTVKVMRTSWVVAPDAAGRIEIVLDRGVLICGERELPICEVELELLAGDANCLFRVAAALQEDCSLRPESDSKAERGIRLVRDEPLRPRKLHRQQNPRPTGEVCTDDRNGATHHAGTRIYCWYANCVIECQSCMSFDDANVSIVNRT